MAENEKRIKYTDNMRQVVDKINVMIDEIFSTIGEYSSLKDYIEAMSSGQKGSVETNPEGVQVTHDYLASDYQVVATATENVNVWFERFDNYTMIYASEEATVDYIILNTSDALKLIREIDAVQEVIDARNGYPTLKDYLDYLENKTPEGVKIRRYAFESTEGDSIISIPQGSEFVTGTNTVDVFISGVKQRSGVDYIEVNSTTLRFVEQLPQGLDVEIIWFEFTPVVFESHSAQHELGGGDEIRLHGSQIVEGTLPPQAFSEPYMTKILAGEEPTSGRWNIGDLVYNTNPEAGGFIGWVCVKAGEFDTWGDDPEFKIWGLISN